MSSLPNARIVISSTDGTSTSINLKDPRTGYPMYPSTTSGLPNPWRFQFGLPLPSQNISSMQILTSLPQTVFPVAQSTFLVYPGEGSSDVLLHSLQDVVELGFKNYIASDTVYNSSGTFFIYKVCNSNRKHVIYLLI